MEALLRHTVLQLSPGCSERPDHFERGVRIRIQEARRLSIFLVHDLRVAQSEDLPVVRVGDGRIHGLQDVALGCGHLGNLQRVSHDLE
jgi:hypothetical protein